MNKIILNYSRIFFYITNSIFPIIFLNNKWYLEFIEDKLILNLYFLRYLASKRFKSRTTADPISMANNGLLCWRYATIPKTINMLIPITDNPTKSVILRLLSASAVGSQNVHNSFLNQDSGLSDRF